MKTNLKAYTLIEVLITIVLVSIISVISYSLFSMISKQLIQYQKANQFDIEYYLLNSTLKKDTYEAVDYKLSDSSFDLILKDEENVNYRVENRKIIRLKEHILDTFNLEVANFSFLEREYNKSKQAEFFIDIKKEKTEIKTNYFVKISISEIINKHYLNED